MPDFADIAALPDDFAGQARLFPLPNLVLFPHVMQPLHIFEPRYRRMLKDALESNRMFIVAMQREGRVRESPSTVEDI